MFHDANGDIFKILLIQILSIMWDPFIIMSIIIFIMLKHRFPTGFLHLENLFKEPFTVRIPEQLNNEIDKMYDIARSNGYKESTIERLIMGLKNT